MKRIRLLLSARDPGAAGHLAVVARHAVQDDRFEVIFVAESPALEILRALDIDALPFHRTGEGTRPLLDAAARLLETAKPDVLLTGLSGPGVGIDEALTACAGDLPNFTFQDFWGDINTALGPPRGTYLVLDETAAALTRARHGAPAIVVGSPKHAAYARLERPELLRQQTRLRLGVPETAPLISFFGQPVERLDAYRRTVETLARAIRRRRGDEVRVLYRPHPKESAEAAGRVRSAFAESGLDCLTLPSTTIEPALCACDLVCSVHSSAGIDNLYLNRLAAVPLGITVFLLVDDELVQAQHAADFKELPPVTAGLAMVAHDTASLEELLDESKIESARQTTWTRIRHGLPDPGGAPATILRQLIDAVASRGRIRVER